MVSETDLRRIVLLEGLPHSILERMLPHVRLHHFGDGDVVYEAGAEAKDFYMLIKGKLLLEVGLSEKVIISLGSIKVGYSFGWSALTRNAKHGSHAVCVEPCDVLSIPGDKFLETLRSDPETAYVVMERIFHIMKRRLERRTGQFVKVMQRHPDINKLLELSEEQ